MPWDRLIPMNKNLLEYFVLSNKTDDLSQADLIKMMQILSAKMNILNGSYCLWDRMCTYQYLELCPAEWVFVFSDCE